MNFEIYDIVYIFGNLFMTYVIYKFMRIFYVEKNTDKKIELGFYGIYFITITILHIFVKIPIILLISNLGLFLMLTLLVLIINFATFYLYDEISRILSDKTDKILMQQQNKYYEKQLELMRLSLKATKTIKHDLKNHMTSLYVLAEDDKKEELLEYLSGVIEVFNSKEGFARTGNVVIDSIINFKLQEVAKEKIDVTVDLNIPKDLKVPSFDITVILGNLLDNALNAVKQLEKNRYINIKVKYTKGRLILKMENSFNGIIIKKEGIIDTSHSDKNNHGLGLESVKTVLKKYDGTIEFEYDDSKFHTALLIFVE